jgi:hypothetical protein
LDCSGLAVEVYLTFSLIPGDRNADGLRQFFAGKATAYPMMGGLAFWGDRVTASHTELIVGEIGKHIMCLGARPKMGVVLRPWHNTRGDSMSMGFVDPFKLEGW